MASIYRTLTLKIIPEFKLEIEDEPSFRFISGRPGVRCYWNNEYKKRILIDDPKRYCDTIYYFLHYYGDTVSVSATIYREMHTALKNGVASSFFKALLWKRVTGFGPGISFGGEGWDGGEGWFRDETLYLFSKVNPSHVTCRRDYKISEASALRNLLHLYFLVKIKEINSHSDWDDINQISKPYLRSDILKVSFKYGFLEINDQDGSLESISDIL